MRVISGVKTAIGRAPSSSYEIKAQPGRGGQTNSDEVFICTFVC